jgi:hypothetical protein
MQDLLKLYQTVCKYQITNHIQELDFTLDIELLKSEILEFIANNKFGFDAVSLRLPKGETNYTDSNEILEATGYGIYDYVDLTNNIQNTRHNNEYVIWHPSLTNSYVVSLVPKLEELTGFKIGRIRLGWLQPNSGYPMHLDLEPLRFHIPIVTNELAFFVNNGTLQHMDYGKLYHIITTDIHTAHNFGFLPRLHLVFSTYVDPHIEEEINKLSSQNFKENIFLEHIPQGVDDRTLAYLLKLYLNQRTPAQSLSDTVYPIQKLRNILNKRK